MRTRFPSVTLLVALALSLQGCDMSSRAAGLGQDAPPYSPEEAIELFEIEPGFEIELFAAEPLVVDPAAMEIDEHGRIYVIELGGYPEKGARPSRIKQLTDTDGDGRPDESIVFADELGMPKGLMRWKDGLLVTDAPDILYLEDTDGDGRADVRDVVLTGFGDYNPQLGVNTPLYGLDNWIHLAHASSSTIHFAEAPEDTFEVSRRNVRFRPDTRALELASAATQFGHSFDAWGRHLMTSNANHLYHQVIDARYVERNPDLLLSTATAVIPDHGAAADVYPITVNPAHQLFTDVGVITAACGVVCYLGDAFPPDYRGVAFVPEPAHNLIHTDRLEEAGATFVARRMQEKREFLASEDSWFRPVNTYVGPDGALYVIDYYREIIEQPKYLSDDVLESGYYGGADRGRIWRIVPEGGIPFFQGDVQAPAHASDAELVTALDHPNIWFRRTAQRLLVDRAFEIGADADRRSERGGDQVDESGMNVDQVVAALEHLVHEGELPEGRLHALWTLDGIGRLTPAIVREALRDEHAGVRENAIRLAERFLVGAGRGAAIGQAASRNVVDTDPAAIRGVDVDQLKHDLVRMSDDAAGREAFQLLLTLGEIEDARAAREDLLMAGIEDEWMQVAALTARNVDAQGLLATAVARLSNRETEGRRAFFRRVASVIAAGGKASGIRHLVRRATQDGDAWWRAAALEGLADGLSGDVAIENELRGLTTRFFEQQSDLRRATLRLLEQQGLELETPIVEHARLIARERALNAELRADAVRLLEMSWRSAQGLREAANEGTGDDTANNGADTAADRAARSDSADEQLFRELLGIQQPLPVQLAAIRALRAAEGKDIGRHLLEKWDVLTPEVRHAAVDVFLADDHRVPLLIEAMEEGRIQPNVIGWDRSKRLLGLDDPDLRRRARALLSTDAASLEEYSAAVELQGNVEAGAAVFERACAMCHQLGGEYGTAVGPDLASIRSRRSEFIITDILRPNREIVSGYEQWRVTQADGTELSGMIAAETPTALTLRTAAGTDHVIPRADVASMETANVSLMPEGLEHSITVQEMADLIAFLRSE